MRNSRSQLSPSVPATSSAAEKQLLQKLEKLPRVEERSALFHLELEKNAQTERNGVWPLNITPWDYRVRPTSRARFISSTNNGAYCRNIIHSSLMGEPLKTVDKTAAVSTEELLVSTFGDCLPKFEQRGISSPSSVRYSD
jgi:hypothetical protein